MSIINDIKADRLAATRAKDKTTKAVLTVLLGEIQRKQSSLVNIPTDEEVLASIKSMVKAIDFTITNRVKLDLPVDEQIIEKNIIVAYQPDLMTDEELLVKIEAGIIFTGAQTPKQMGAVMGYLSKNYKGLYDGAKAKDIVLIKLKGV